ncbi:hypothetical protein V7095_06800 [Bacillus thuringiensis]|nr:hypothetical protein [Bacillus thuringiensis]
MEKYEDIMEALEAAQFATEETGIVHEVKPIRKKRNSCERVPMRKRKS